MALSLGGITFALTVIWGGPLLQVLRWLGVGKQIRIEGPRSHQSKLGTPTMGGLLVIIPVVIITLLLNTVSILGRSLLGRSILLPLGVFLGFAALGGVDDWLGLRRRPLRFLEKLGAECLIALIAAIGLKFVLNVPGVFLPGLAGYFDLGLWYLPVAVLVIVSSTNRTGTGSSRGERRKWSTG